MSSQTPSQPGGSPRTSALTPQALRRRFAELRMQVTRRRHRGEAAAHQRGVERSRKPADVMNPRAKSSRHGKSTAYKWNQ